MNFTASFVIGNSGTGSAESKVMRSIFISTGVLWREFVAMAAVCSGLFAISSHSRPSPHMPPACIYKGSDGFQMVRIYAPPVTANATRTLARFVAGMVQIQTVWNRAFVLFIRHAVSGIHSKGPAAFPESSISAVVNAGSPKPASTNRVNLNVPHQSVFDAKYGSCFILASGHLISSKDRCLQAVETFARLAAFSILTQFSVKQWMRQQGSGA